MNSSRLLLRRTAGTLSRTTTTTRSPLATRSIHSSTSSPSALRPACLTSHIAPRKSNANLCRRWNSSAAAAEAASSGAAASSLEAPDYLCEGELKIFNIIKDELRPQRLEVQDISGGCGSMYALDIVSDQFKGLPVIKQHRLVNKILGEEIKKWHGVQLKTKAP